MADALVTPPRTPIERVFAARSDVSGRALQQFYLTGEDNLRVFLTNWMSGGTVVVSGRVWDETAGQIQVFSDTVTLLVPHNVHTYERKLPRGSLINLRVGGADGSTFALGDIWARLEVIRGFGSQAVPLATVLQGYPSPENSLGWPGTPNQSQHDGRGRLRTIVAAINAAPVRATLTTSSGVRWELVSGLVSLATDATAGNRTAFFRVFAPSGNLIFESQGQAGIPPSTTSVVSYGAAAPASPAGIVGAIVLSTPVGLEMSINYVWDVAFTGTGAGDVLTSGEHLVREWFDG